MICVSSHTVVMNMLPYVMCIYMWLLFIFLCMMWYAYDMYNGWVLCYPLSLRLTYNRYFTSLVEASSGLKGKKFWSFGIVGHSRGHDIHSMFIFYWLFFQNKYLSYPFDDDFDKLWLMMLWMEPLFIIHTLVFFLNVDFWDVISSFRKTLTLC